MEHYNANREYRAGDIVYLFYRNPHTQDVANIQATAVVNSPDNFLPEIHCEKLKRERMVLISPPEKEEDMRTVLYTERTCSYKSVFEEYIRYKQMDVKDSEYRSD